jgi:DNA-directed RNA polymerase subunit RPC12/RpoP
MPGKPNMLWLTFSVDRNIWYVSFQKVKPFSACYKPSFRRRVMSTIRFFCTICGSALMAENDSTIPLAECAHCRHTVPVPTAIDNPWESGEPMPVMPEGVIALHVCFLCPRCHIKLRTDARMEGRSVECPECSQPIQVPVWSRRESPLVGLDTAEVEFLSALDEIEAQPGGREA